MNLRRKPLRPISRARQWLYAALSLALALLLPPAFFLVYAGLIQYRTWEARQDRVVEASENHLARYHPRLGWVPRAPMAAPDLFAPGRHLHFNRQGLRAVREYPRQAPAGRRRALCLGDSFMFGLGVDDAETFPAQLEALGGVEALNLGLMGYGLDQAFLRYQAEMDNFDHDTVILGLITDDFRRLLTDRGGFGLFKPRFALRGEALELTGVPTPPPLKPGDYLFPETRWQFIASRYPLTQRLIPKSWLANPNQRDDPLQSESLAQRIILDLKKLCRAHRRELVLVWFPAWQDFRDPAARLVYRRHQERFVPFARQAGVRLLDLTTLVKDGNDPALGQLFLDEPYHHPSAAGFRLFAEKMLKYITISGK